MSDLLLDKRMSCVFGKSESASNFVAWSIVLLLRKRKIKISRECSRQDHRRILSNVGSSFHSLLDKISVVPHILSLRVFKVFVVAIADSSMHSLEKIPCHAVILVQNCSTLNIESFRKYENAMLTRSANSTSW